VSIPAVPNVVQILEDYIKHFGLNELAILNRKRRESENNSKKTSLKSKGIKATAKPSPSIGQLLTSSSAKPPEKSLATVAGEKIRDELAPLLQDVETLKEHVDSLRILFDFMLHQILLYGVEREQFHECYERKLHTPFDTVLVIIRLSKITKLKLALVVNNLLQVCL